MRFIAVEAQMKLRGTYVQYYCVLRPPNTVPVTCKSRMPVLRISTTVSSWGRRVKNVCIRSLFELLDPDPVTDCDSTKRRELWP